MRYEITRFVERTISQLENLTQRYDEERIQLCKDNGIYSLLNHQIFPTRRNRPSITDAKIKSGVAIALARSGNPGLIPMASITSALHLREERCKSYLTIDKSSFSEGRNESITSEETIVEKFVPE